MSKGSFKVIGIVQQRQLSDVLTVFEQCKIPYNVELHEAPKPVVKARKNGGPSGADFILSLLKKGPKTRKMLQNAFEKDGRSPASVNSQIHNLQSSKVITHNKDEGYSLTERGRREHK